MASAPNPANGTDVNLWSVVIAAGSFALNFVIACGTAIWAIGRSKIATDDKIANVDKATAIEFANKDKAMTASLAVLERRVFGEMDAVRQEVGETVTALATKVTQTELWNRDHFVDKETYKEMRQDMRELRDGIDDLRKWLERKLEGVGPRRADFGG
ncbi:MAG: hypothetical protein KGL39_50915 [Patescibacteria group bacterium]|nr:hypothetical protein [Patescibacteria group bacterium]